MLPANFKKALNYQTEKVRDDFNIKIMDLKFTQMAQILI